MLRNQDRPELLLFVTTNAARWTDGAERPGVARLVAEAADAGTPSLWICADDPKPVGGLKPTPWPANAPALPCPQALQDARASLEIEPDGFGGGMGGAGGTRGRKMPAPVWKSTSVSGTAMRRPSWLGRAVRNRHRHAIEQASRRWRGGRRDDSARTRRNILISTQAGARAAPGAVRGHRAESRGGDRGAERGHARRWALLGGRGDARWRGAAHESNFKMHPLDGVERNMTH
jgi:hypothetical protein